uniref:Uncharacterized protein n=1 Tax=Anguilla anguilla TaxID=7936 RepID=A0A0E9SXM4_ANGAN
MAVKKNFQIINKISQDLKVQSHFKCIFCDYKEVNM